MLKFLNTERTFATFNGASIALAAREDWDSIGDAPTREAVKAWIAAGNTPELAGAAEMAIPQAVSRRQGRLALLQTPHPDGGNWLDAVESAIASIADQQQQRAAQIEYEADTWERSSGFLQSMWSQLGGADEQLDQLFSLAATL